jgi:hypothetical protein
MKLKQLKHFSIIENEVLKAIFGGQKKGKKKKKKKVNDSTKGDVSSDSTDTVKNDRYK